MNNLNELLNVPLKDKDDVLLNISLNASFYFNLTLEENYKNGDLGFSRIVPYIEVAAGEIFKEHKSFIEKLNVSYRYTNNPQTQKWVDLAQENHIMTPDIWLRMNANGCAYTITYHNGLQPDDAPDTYFTLVMKRVSEYEQVNDPSLSYLNLGVPISIIKNSALFEEYLSLVKKWVTQLKPLHGYCGLQLTKNHYRSQELWPYEYQLTQKLPGLNFDDQARVVHDLSDSYSKIKGTQWITIVNKDLLDKAQLNNLDDIRNKCPDAKILTLNNNIMFQADKTPELLELSAAYQQIAQYLEPVRYTGFKSPHEARIIKDNYFVYDDKTYQSWLARYL